MKAVLLPPPLGEGWGGGTSALALPPSQPSPRGGRSEFKEYSK
jgi:hypothetical protein